MQFYLHFILDYKQRDLEKCFPIFMLIKISKDFSMIHLLTIANNWRNSNNY